VAERAFLATILQALSRGQVELLSDRLIQVDGQGTITSIDEATAPEIDRLSAAGRLERLGPGKILLPGLIDLHIHAPQWPQRGKALDRPLEDWLQHHTFPLEARFSDLAFAAEVYESLVDGLLANGTTTAVYFATLHLPATQLLAELCLARGQRALIGRVAMDDASQCPPFYRDASAEIAEAETRALIDHVRGMAGNQQGLVRPVITPRFIPSCTDDLLGRLGRLADESGCHVQTHCSESDWEQDFVSARCGVTDCAALDRFGLLSRHTILAHGNFIDEGDQALIRSRGAAIAHCPLSNAFFADSVFPLRRALDAGLHVGLGSDIAGGASPSILASARHAVIAARTLESGVDPALPRDQRGRPGSRITALEAFWLATAGGGQALDLPIGLLQPGYQFDAILIDRASPGSDLYLAPEDGPEDMLQKIVHLGSRADISRVWVGGRRVA